jgi:hypothetical protein
MELLALFQKATGIKGIYYDTKRENPNQLDMITNACVVSITRRQSREPYISPHAWRMR